MWRESLIETVQKARHPLFGRGRRAHDHAESFKKNKAGKGESSVREEGAKT
jgi:hypothetical protein